MFDSPSASIPAWAVAPLPGRRDPQVPAPRARTAAVPGAVAVAPGLTEVRSLTVAARTVADAARDAAGWDAVTRSQVLRELDLAAGALAAARARVLVAEEAAATSLRPGDRDFAAARARLTRTGLGEAKREIRLAQTLDTLPTVADAVCAGRVPVAHADALARAAATAGDETRRRLTEPGTQAELVSLAGRLPVREFAAAAERLVATFEPESVEREHDRQRSRRFLTLSHQADGTHLKALLDRVAGAALRVALDGMGFAPDATRTKQQADADALVAMVERGMSGIAGVRRTGRPGGAREAALWDAEQREADARVSGVAARPTVSVLVPAATVAEVAARRGSTGAGDETAPFGDDLEPALLEDGTVLPLSELGRFLCDSEVGRIVLDSDSVPIDLGRTTRLFTATQRRAVIVRDRGCAWNGCDVPAAYCEVHHIRWWDRDRGPTDLENGVLLCSHHHHTVHRHDLSIVRAGTPVRRRGTWAEPQRYRFSDANRVEINAPPGQPAGACREVARV